MFCRPHARPIVRPIVRTTPPPARTTVPRATLVNACISAGYLGFFLYFSLNWDMYRQMRLRDEEREDDEDLSI